MKIRIDKSKEYQTYKGIGASGAWWAQCVGGWDHTLDGEASVRDTPLGEKELQNARAILNC